MDEGVVEEINGNECVVFFKKSGSKEVLSLDEVERRLKRAKLGGKKEVVEENKNFKQEKDENKESSAENLRSVAKIAEKYEKKAGKVNNISEENKFPEKNLEKTKKSLLKIQKNRILKLKNQPKKKILKIRFLLKIFLRFLRKTKKAEILLHILKMAQKAMKKMFITQA